MKKDMPHAGFPEAAFQRYAEILVSLVKTLETRCKTPIKLSNNHNTCTFLTVSKQSMTSLQVDLGYKVARIEQTETPAQMSERCAQMSRPSKFDKGTYV